MNVALRPEHLDIISLCTGGGGLDLGIELAIPGARSVCMVEREAFAVARLVSAMEAGLMAPAPIWSDARTFVGRAWRGCVDGVISGIPCQPHSVAGRKRGSNDDRDLWSDARRIIVQSRAWFALIENVGGMLSAGNDEIAGAQRVFRDLSKLGFSVEGGLFTASEVGAPHGRERIFILAVADCISDIQQRGRSGEVQGTRCATEGKTQVREWGGNDSRDGGKRLSGVGLANPCGSRLQGRKLGGPSRCGDRPEASRSTAEFRSSPLADASRSGHDRGADDTVRLQVERTSTEGAGSRSVTAMDDTSIARGRTVPVQPRRQVEAHSDLDRPSLFAPGPSDRNGWRDVLERASHLEPSICRVADGMASNVDELRMLGNGVVPLQAAYAVSTLATRLAGRGSSGAARLVRMMVAA